MGSVPQIYNGLSGTRAINTIGNMPSFGYTNNGLNKPVMKLNWKTTNYLENMTSLRQSVLLTNQSGTRGVKPCKGIVSVGGASGSRVLRGPAMPFEQGLAYDPQKPINQPLMPQASSFNAALNSRLGQPSSLVF